MADKFFGLEFQSVDHSGDQFGRGEHPVAELDGSVAGQVAFDLAAVRRRPQPLPPIGQRADNQTVFVD
nr:hypothetical protein [Micromonospora sp. DSM 115978]